MLKAGPPSLTSLAWDLLFEGHSHSLTLRCTIKSRVSSLPMCASICAKLHPLVITCFVQGWSLGFLSSLIQNDSFPTHHYLLGWSRFPLMTEYSIHPSHTCSTIFETPYDEIIPLKSLPLPLLNSRVHRLFQCFVHHSQFLVYIPDSI